jgi:hypothetical protein
MSTQFLEINRPTQGLKGVIEPLASYICAADRPRAALLSVYRALLSEVEQTNRAAQAHFGTSLQRR